jgi:isopenicillin-N N-acyltransferase-like protein
MSQLHFRFSGTTYEQGLAHGETLRESIEKNIDVYLTRFDREAGICKQDLLVNAGIYMNKLRGQSPEYVSAMNGIAESSNREILEIAMLNLRYELLYYALGKIYIDESVDGCTSFALLPEASQNNHVVMGQNWDWIPDVDCVLVTSTDSDGLRRTSFTEAGIFAGKPGMNSEGVGLAVNGMCSTADNWARFHKPFHLRCYEILRSRTMDDALDVLTDSPRSCTANFIIGGAPHGAVDIELAPDSLRSIDPDNGVLVHTNHFRNLDKIDATEPPNPRRHLSEFRQVRMERLLDEQKPLNVKSIQEILGDHENHPQSLCRHRDNMIPESQHIITKTSMIMDMEDQKIWLSFGQPCKNDFKMYDVS